MRLEYWSLKFKFLLINSGLEYFLDDDINHITTSWIISVNFCVTYAYTTILTRPMGYILHRVNVLLLEVYYMYTEAP